MAPPLIDHFRLLARYNEGANRALYRACARLPDAERSKPRPAFFASILGTLNHIMVADRIWLTRFQGGEAPSSDLGAILYQDFDELRAARAAEDRRIEAFADGLTEAFLADRTRYVDHAGESRSDANDLLVAHFFNHQTHHRGQIHDMLSQTEVAPPSLDLHRILRP